MEGILALVGQILLEGMKLWNDARKTRFQAKHHEIIRKISESEGKIFPDYTDASLMLANQELNDFMKAYYLELKEVANEKHDTNSSS